MMDVMRQVWLLSMMLLLSCCATMVNGTKEQIPVKSDPAGAVVTVECGDAPLYGGLTPAVITVDRKADPCELTIAKEGYVQEHVALTRELSRAMLANKVPGAVFGTLLAVAGAAIEIDSSNVDGELVAGGWQGGMYLGSAPGNAIDQRTGAAFRHTPGEVFVKLQAATPPDK